MKKLKSFFRTIYYWREILRINKQLKIYRNMDWAELAANDQDIKPIKTVVTNKKKIDRMKTLLSNIGKKWQGG